MSEKKICFGQLISTLNLLTNYYSAIENNFVNYSDNLIKIIKKLEKSEINCEMIQDFFASLKNLRKNISYLSSS